MAAHTPDNVVELTNSNLIRAREHLCPELILGRHELEMNGFAFIPSSAIRSALSPGDLTDIIDAVASAPVDPYDSTRSRYRRYSQLYRHHDGSLGLIPPFQDGPCLPPYTSYFQASYFNQQFGDRDRRFSPFSNTVLDGPSVQQLVNICFALIPRWRLKKNGRNSVLVGLHGQKLTSDGRRAAVATPPNLHQDGEPFTFVIMLARENATGGVSYVAEADAAGKSPDDLEEAQILARRTLADPLDTLAIDDERVSHHVSGVLGSNGQPGYRSVLLIDFSELELVRSKSNLNEE